MPGARLRNTSEAVYRKTQVRSPRQVLKPGAAAKNSNRAYLMATDTQVLVVGAGPVGLFMAAELNLAWRFLPDCR